MASKFAKTQLPIIVDQDKKNHLSKRPQDKNLIESVAGGHYISIDKIIKKEGVKI